MQAEIHPFPIRRQRFCLSGERAVFWEEKRILIVSDLHFGKTGHFRKWGIGVPQTIFREDLHRLFSLVQFFKPEELLVVGDMFHSTANRELDLFLRWRMDFRYLLIRLVRGNHDILPDAWYKEARIGVSDHLEWDGFRFCHALDQEGSLPDAMPVNQAESDQPFLFCGHIHPGISVPGPAKQSLHFPCFYFTESFAILPAFSRFTGTSRLNLPSKGKAFAIVERSLVAVG